MGVESFGILWEGTGGESQLGTRAGEDSQLDQKTSWRRVKKENKLETCGRRLEGRVSWRPEDQRRRGMLN